MSATGKSIAAAILLASMAGAVQAQSLTDLLSSVVGGEPATETEAPENAAPPMTAAPAPAPVVQTAPASTGITPSAVLNPDDFDKAVANLLKDMNGGAPVNPNDLTIEDLDRLNRETQRRQSELALDKAQLERTKVQLELLMTLRAAVVQNQQAQAAAAQAAAEAAAAQQREEGEDGEGGEGGEGSRERQASQPSPEQMMAMEAASLPRVSEIIGVGNQLEARLTYPGGTEVTVVPGSTLPMGVQVVEMTNRSVTLRAGSGIDHVLLPGAGLAAPMQPSNDEDRGLPDGAFPVDASAMGPMIPGSF